MLEALLAVADHLFPHREMLSKEDIAKILECDPKVISHWVKRTDPAKRPPRLLLGSDHRFPKREMMRWVVENQGR